MKKVRWTKWKMSQTLNINDFNDLNLFHISTHLNSFQMPIIVHSIIWNEPMTRVSCCGNIISNSFCLAFQLMPLEWLQYRSSIAILWEKASTQNIFIIRTKCRKSFSYRFSQLSLNSFKGNKIPFEAYLGINRRRWDTEVLYFIQRPLASHISFSTHRLCSCSCQLAGIMKRFTNDFVTPSSNWMIETQSKTRKLFCVSWFGFMFESKGLSNKSQSISNRNWNGPYQNRTKYHCSWFTETADVFSPYVLIQLITSAVVLAASLFQIDLVFYIC